MQEMGFRACLLERLENKQEQQRGSLTFETMPTKSPNCPALYVEARTSTT